MKGFHFFADLPGTLAQPEDYSGRYGDTPVFPKRTTRKQLREAAERGELCNVVALMLGDEHLCRSDYSQECLSATFGHADSDTSLGSVSRDYLKGCRRIPEALARKLHPRLFARLDAEGE
jgi:hypothetical protein